MLYDKHGRQGLLDAEDVGISLDGVRLPTITHSRPPRTGLAAFRDPNEVFFDVFGFREPPNGVLLHHAGTALSLCHLLIIFTVRDVHAVV